MVAGTAEISYLKTLSQNQKPPWGWWDTFEASKPIPVAYHLFQGHISQFLPNTSTNWRPSVQTMIVQEALSFNLPHHTP